MREPRERGLGPRIEKGKAMCTTLHSQRSTEDWLGPPPSSGTRRRPEAIGCRFGAHLRRPLGKGPASRLEIRPPMNLDALHTWTVITDSPMAARVAMAAFLVMKEWTILGRVFVESLKSLTVRKARRAVKKAINRPTYSASPAGSSIRAEPRSSSGVLPYGRVGVLSVPFEWSWGTPCRWCCIRG